MINRLPSFALRRSLKGFKTRLPTNDGRRTTKILFLVLGVALLLGGCKAKPKFAESRLPLPPAVDSGVLNGEFFQVEYGFGFPVPPKWLYLRLSADQEVDEVARFSDPLRELTVRVTVRILNSEEKYSSKAWADQAEQDLKNHLFKIKKREAPVEWKTTDSSRWVSLPFRLSDPRGGEWANEEWALNQGDLLIGVHAFVPQKIADTEKGKKYFKAMQASLAQIHWYTPIGPRGVSVERFELQHFTESFRQSLESRSLPKTTPFFDEMYPERVSWASWYQQLVAGDPKSFDLKVELTGLVINGDFATVSFSFIRKDKGGAKPQKYEKSFKLSKKEGHWEITNPLDKN
jgi:hypothetical protein